MDKRYGAESVFGIGGGSVSRQAAKALQRAEELLRKRKPEQALPHIFKALEDPECLDVACQISSLMPTTAMAVRVLDQAAEMGRVNLRRKLGSDCFEDGSEQVGQFWSILETRPYMRVLQTMVRFSYEAGDIEKSVNTMVEMLRLCPGDNLSQREWLGTMLLKANRNADALSFSQIWLNSRGTIPLRGGCTFEPPSQTPLSAERYAKEKRFGSGEQNYTAALASFRLWGDCELARQYLRIATELNPHVIRRVLGKVTRPTELNNNPRSMNGPESAHDYLWLAQDLWMEPAVWQWANSDEEIKPHVLKECSRPECTNQETRAVEFKRCSGCKEVSYCGALCQKSDWPRHKPDCKKAQQFKDILRSFASGKPPKPDDDGGVPVLASADFSQNGITTKFL